MRVILKNRDFMNYSLSKKDSMIDLINAICASRAAVVSLFSVASGTALQSIPDAFFKKTLFVFNNSLWWVPPSFGVALQWAAWTIAIFAGIVSIVNGTKNWFKCEEKVPVKVDETKKESE